MPAAAIVGAVATVGGAALSASASNKASKRAAQTAADTAASNNATALQIRQENNALLSPYSERGNAAGDTINALLGLPTATYTQSTQQSAQPPVNYERLYNAPGMVGAGFRFTGLPSGLPAQPNPSAQAAVQPQINQQDAFNTFLNSTGYQFRFNEGMNGLNALNAARGTLDSGAAVKSALQYGQNIGSQEFGKYMGYLGNQQGVGLSGASAVAGVGQNYANNVMANNNSAGSAAANAALINGTSQGQMYGSIGNALGGLASSFGGQKPNPYGIMGGNIY